MTEMTTTSTRVTEVRQIPALVSLSLHNEQLSQKHPVCLPELVTGRKSQKDG